jgi:hypothetical protein
MDEIKQKHILKHRCHVNLAIIFSINFHLSIHLKKNKNNQSLNQQNNKTLKQQNKPPLLSIGNTTRRDFIGEYRQHCNFDEIEATQAMF